MGDWPWDWSCFFTIEGLPHKTINLFHLHFNQHKYYNKESSLQSIFLSITIYLNSKHNIVKITFCRQAKIDQQIRHSNVFFVKQTTRGFEGKIVFAVEINWYYQFHSVSMKQNWGNSQINLKKYINLYSRETWMYKNNQTKISFIQNSYLIWNESAIYLSRQKI